MAVTKDDVKVQLKLEKAAQFKREAKQSGDAVEHIGKSSEKAAAKAELFSKANEHVNKTLFRMGTLLGFAELSLGGALVEGAKKSLEAFEQSQSVQAQTAAALKSTGDAAHVTAGHIAELATALSRKVGIDDEAIASSENLLLTFTQIRNGSGKNRKVFDETTRAVVDMSVAMHMRLNNAAVLVGKALNNPINGLSRLQRVGVQFTVGQEKQIKSLAAHHKAAKAQVVILRELEREFGKSAIAAGKTGAGAMGKLKVEINNVQEMIGKALAPRIDHIVDKLTEFAKQIEENTGAGGRFRKEILDIAFAIRDKIIPDIVNMLKHGYEFLQWIHFSATDAKVLIGVWAGFAILIKATGWVIRFREAMVLLNAVEYANPILAAVGAIAALTIGFTIAYRRSAKFRSIVHDILNFIKRYWPFIVGFFTGPLGLAVALMIQHLGSVISFVKGMPGKLSSAGTAVFDWLKTAAINAVNFVIDKVNWLIRAFNNTLGRVPGVPNVGQLQKLGTKSVTQANSDAYKGYSGIPTGPSPRSRSMQGGGRGLSSPLAPITLKHETHIRLDSKDITNSTLKSTRDKARRR